MARKDLKKFKKNNINFCYYCNEFHSENDITVDHKTSKTNGGTNCNDNIVIACHSCNNEKGALNEREFRNYLRYKSYLKSVTIEQLHYKCEMFAEILKKDNIENGKRNFKDKPYLIRSIGIKIKAVRNIIKNG